MAGGHQGVDRVASDHSTVEHLQELIDWRESALFGAGAWVVSLGLTVLVLSVSGVTDEQTEHSSLELSTWVLFESVGGTVESDASELFSLGLYSTLDSNAYGLGVAIHALVPLVVLVIAGYWLAGRYQGRGDVAGPVEGVIAGASLTAGFVAAFLIGLIIFDDAAVSVEFLDVLVLGGLYSLVFASVGATLRTATTVRSLWGLLGGVGAFVLGVIAWQTFDEPFETLPGESFGDLDGTFEQTSFVAEFVATHGVEADALLPEWYVMVALLVVGAAVAYRHGSTDPIASSGRGARIAIGYGLVVTIAYLAYVGALLYEINEQATGAWPLELVDVANVAIATAPITIVLAGFVFPAVFGAIGGAIGAKLYESQSDGTQTAE